MAIAARDFHSTEKPPEYSSWYEYVRTKVEILKTLRNKTHTEHIFPDIVDGFSLLSLSDNTLCYAEESRRKIRSWPLTGGHPSSLIKRPTSPALVETSGGKLVIVGTKYLHQIDIATKKEECSVSLEHLSQIQPISYTKRFGDTLFLGAKCGTLGAWDTKSGKLRSFYSGLSKEITHLDSNSLYVAAASADGIIGIWNLQGKSLATLSCRACSRIFLYEHMLLIVDTDAVITLWDIVTNTEIGSVSTILRTHIGKGLQPLIQIMDPLAIISENGSTLDVWHLQTKTKVETHAIHPAPVSHFALSGSTFFTGSDHGDIAIWQVSDTGLVLKYHHHIHRGTTRKIVPLDTDLVLSYADDGKAHIWKSATGELLQSFDLKKFDLIDILYAKGRLLFVSGNNILAAITFARPTATTTSPRLSFRL